MDEIKARGETKAGEIDWGQEIQGKGVTRTPGSTIESLTSSIPTYPSTLTPLHFSNEGAFYLGEEGLDVVGRLAGGHVA